MRIYFTFYKLNNLNCPHPNLACFREKKMAKLAPTNLNMKKGNSLGACNSTQLSNLLKWKREICTGSCTILSVRSKNM